MSRPKKAVETDSAYFLKILLYFILGTIWLQYQGRTIFPIGLILGVIFARHDHFQIDRKMEYLILILSAFLGLIGQGLMINLTR